MKRKLVVLDIVGLTPGLLGENTPNLSALASDGFQASLRGVFPAVTCSAQSTMLTGALPRTHGIVGNGWYYRDLAEVLFWRQSNRLVTAPKVWETLRERRPGFTCAKIFWWYNMYSTADWSITPRPVYPADGRKLPGIYAEPPELRQVIERELGAFPFLSFWGPFSGLPSTAWITRTARIVIERYAPDLTLAYLPHLDYDFQRFGPSDKRCRDRLLEVDREAGELIRLARERDMEVLAVSEYGLAHVDGSVSLNRELRRQGFLRVRDTAVGEMLDTGACRAFAAADHQVAHVYVRDTADVAAVKEILEATDGVDFVLDEEGKRQHGLDHPRSGELVAVATPTKWFDYYYWLDDERAPDFARTVDIHRKPGYDPVELFLNPAMRLAKLRIFAKLVRMKLGFRTLLDVIPLDTSLVRGSHGRCAENARNGPLLISSTKRLETSELAMTDVAGFIQAVACGNAGFGD